MKPTFDSLATLFAGNNAYYLYAIPVLLAVIGYVWWSRRGERRARETHEQALESGGAEPVSLHPIIDPGKCIGCGACTHACPEGDILGLIGGKAVLVDPRACIGHGACKTSCPVGAIELVFGSSRRGVEIPQVAPWA
jgi:thioredoxin reductase (NADPH)